MVTGEGDPVDPLLARAVVGEVHQDHGGLLLLLPRCHVLLGWNRKLHLREAVAHLQDGQRTYPPDRFLDEALAEFGVGRQRGREDLQRHGPIELRLARFVDDAHPALPELGENLERSELASREERVNGGRGLGLSHQADRANPAETIGHTLRAADRAFCVHIVLRSPIP